MSEFLANLKTIGQETSEKVSVEDLRETLAPIYQSLLELKEKKAIIEIELKDINQLIIEEENKIRKVWLPHMKGDSGKIKIGDATLKIEKILNASIDDKDVAIDWFMSNNHKDVLKYDIHSSTLKSIATKYYKNGTEIPGLKYTSFYKIK